LKLLRLLLLPFIIVGRRLFWFLLAIAAWLLFRHLKKKAAAQGTPAAAPESEKAVENMVACQRCGLLLPESESVRQGDAHFCCEEHLRGR